MKACLLPDGFEVITAIVSDFHLGTPIEMECEKYLMERGLRKDFPSIIWRWMTRPAQSTEMAHELLSKLRHWTDQVISLGDHYSTVVNEHGLAEKRARISALWTLDFFNQYNWSKIVWVPSDHDIGVPHKISRDKTRNLLLNHYREFEETDEFRGFLRNAIATYPEYDYLLDKSSCRAGDSFGRSSYVYERFFGPLSGVTSLGPISVIWCSDAKIEKRSDMVGQNPFLSKALTSGTPTLFCVHSPQTLSTIEGMIGGNNPQVVGTVAGHLHTPWMARFVVPQGLSEKFKLTVCPSLTGNRLTDGGALLLGKVHDSFRMLRYSLNKNTLRYV